MKTIVQALLICVLLFCCHRKQRADPLADIPDLPSSDTVYVPRLVSRCNYQYLSANPKKAKKQLEEAERQLDQLIIEFDPRLNAKRKLASKLIRENETVLKN